MTGSPERQGQFIFSEENLAQGTVAEKNLYSEEKVVLAEGEECKIEIKIGEEEATVSIFNLDGSFVRHSWRPRRGEFSRSSRSPLNHGAFLDPEKQSLSVEFTKDGEKIRRTVFWKETDA